MAVVTRKAAWSAKNPANGWTDDLIWYAAAIHQMKVLTPGLDEYVERVRNGDETSDELFEIVKGWSNPASLGYQSQVHATYLLPSSLWPSHQGTRVIWQQCAHNNWFFLPWHRAFLLEFEAVARAHIHGLNGPADTWALPYWNSSDYAKIPDAAGLPLPLRDESLPTDVTIPGVDPEPDGTFRNPLYDRTRGLKGNAKPWAHASAAMFADASDALSRHHFATARDTHKASFGGGYLEDVRDIHNADEIGQLDMHPHGSVHNTVAGNMSGFETAGLDPVFWMHHANIDRLWETYARDLGHGYPFADGEPDGPPKKSWSKEPFPFLRPDGTVVSWTAPMVRDITKLALGQAYEYDTTKPPNLLPSGPGPDDQDDDPFGLVAVAPEPVADATNIDLAPARTVQLSGGDPGDDGTGLGGAGARWRLRFDGIRSTRPAITSYEVYLEPAPDSDPSRFVGLLSLFGVFEASRDTDGVASGSGQTRLFEVTTAVNDLGAGFNPLRPVVRLVPQDPERDLDGVGLTIGRISLDVG